MPIEGFVLLHPRGHYAIYQPNLCHQLHPGDRLAVHTGETWLEMEVAHSMEGYYLMGQNISFYPVRVWARLLSPHPLTPSPTTGEGESNAEKKVNQERS